jgi:serine/threonine protein phosphatase 1
MLPYSAPGSDIMLDAIRQIFRPKPKPTRLLPAVPPGERVYAVGDVHGRRDLFVKLVEAIEEDDRRRGDAQTTIVLLGDLVDRGPDSSGVIAAARDLQSRRSTRIIAGNHEEMFLESLESIDTLRHFLRFGGRETVLSYPMDSGTFDSLTVEQMQQAMRLAVPAADIAFVQDFEHYIEIGDYLFVHAGIRPGVPLSEQAVRDLRWIREPFLSNGHEHGWCVVHGHTITDAPEIRHNRIGIDTGAYMSGRLTALGLEGTERWFIETGHSDGAAVKVTRTIA